jgi:phosphoribosylamine---glycine ligase
MNTTVNTVANTVANTTVNMTENTSPNQIVLVVGNGAREHALVWKLLQSPQVSSVLIAPGNGAYAGMARVTQLNVKVDDAFAIAQAAQSHGATFAVIGPEAALATGVVDVLNTLGIAAFGPNQNAAQLESSKAFAKYFMQDAGIPTAEFGVFVDYGKALEFIRSKPFNPSGACVVKADGLAAGKGVAVCFDLAQAEAGLANIMRDQAYGAAGAQVVIEALLPGREISILAFCDGKTVRRMPAARDHKRLSTGDLGPNTGGMGAFSPVADITPQLLAQIDTQVFEPFLAQLKTQNIHYCGVIYAGLMIDTLPNGDSQIGVLEFNTRFGDPETQVLMGLLNDDILSVMQACVAGDLASRTVQWHDHACLTVVMAAKGYPDAPLAGDAITLPAQLPSNVAVFQAGTAFKDGQLVTAGGRVLSVTAWGDSVTRAREAAYAVVNQISFQGAQYRTDISLTQGQQ